MRALALAMVDAAGAAVAPLLHLVLDGHHWIATDQRRRRAVPAGIGGIGVLGQVA